jgi:hypothetical protein
LAVTRSTPGTSRSREVTSRTHRRQVIALQIGRGTLRKMRQNLGWAVGYNAIALPIAAGVFEPAFGLVLRPEIAALSMSGSSLIVAVNALTLKRLQRVPDVVDAGRAASAGGRTQATGGRGNLMTPRVDHVRAGDPAWGVLRDAGGPLGNSSDNK